MGSASAVWTAVAFGVAATWGLTVVVNKRTLRYVDPIALNLLMRIPTLVFLAPATTVLALEGTWGLSFDMTWTAFGYQTLNAFVTWVVAFNAYFLTLRLGSLGVVAPVMATDPLFAGVFSVIILGGSLDGSLIAGLLVATAGVALLARWTEAGGATSGREQGGRTHDAEVMAEPPPGAELVPPLLDTPGKSFADTRAAAGRSHELRVILLALLAAAGWGLGPVIVELAVGSIGGASSSLILQNQLMGILFLLPIVAWRRRVIIRPMGRRERRLVVLLIVVAGALESVFALAYYLLIDEIGAVLTVLIIASSPLFTILGGMVFLRERYSWRLAVGGLVTIAGVALAVTSPF